MIYVHFHRGNVVGVQPYATGSPSCSSHGMAASSRYSGLCVSSQTVYTPNNQVITQNTYTFKSERINPTVYRTVSAYSPYSVAPQTTTTAIQAYQQALQTYQNPSQTYDQAQHNYQLAIQAYNQAYGSPHQTQTVQPYTYTQTVQPTIRSNSYDWSVYFG